MRCWRASSGYIGFPFFTKYPVLTADEIRTRLGSCSADASPCAAGAETAGSCDWTAASLVAANSSVRTILSVFLSTLFIIHLCRFAEHRLRTVHAAPCVDRNLAQALGTLLGGRSSRWRFFLHPRYQPVHRNHD